MTKEKTMKAYRDEVFCSECSANLALGIDSEIAETVTGKQYIKRTLYLFCPNQNCPAQSKRRELPEA
jgi:hypothetical protein